MNKYKNKKEEILQLIMFIMPQFLYTIYICMTGRIRFATNDDLVVVDILSGKLGKPYPFVTGTSVIFGYVQNFLYKLFPYFNWNAITYLLLIFIGFVIIDIAFIKEKSSLFEMFFKGILLFDVFFLFINHFTFTIAAYAGCMSGMIWGIHNLKEKDTLFQKKNIVTAILIFFGILIRPSVIQSFILVIILYAVYEFIIAGHKGLLLLCIICFIGMRFITGINSFVYSFEPIQKEYNEWNSARAGVTDFIEKDELDNVLNWTETDYEALYNVFLYDKELFSTQNLKDLRKANGTLRYQKNFKKLFAREDGVITSTVEMERNYNHFVKLFFVTIICVIACNKKNWFKYFLITISTVASSILFFIMGRSVYRVLMPGYVFGILLLLLVMKYVLVDRKPVFKCSILIILIGISIVILTTEVKNRQLFGTFYDEKNIKVIRYIEENPDVLYLPCDSGVFALGLAESVFAYKRDIKKNIIGNWDMYSVPYYELINSYQFRNPNQLVLDLTDYDNIQLVTIHGSEIPEYIIEFIEERNGFQVEAILKNVIRNTTVGEWRFYNIKKLK